VVELQELLACLGAAIHTQVETPEIVGLRKSLAGVPREIREEAFDLVGLAGIGTAPLMLDLKKGKSYAVVGWREGHKAGITTIEESFNPARRAR
jgi:hypothetical protein